MPITITPQDLAQVKDRASLFAFLNQTLGWPLDPEDTFTYDEPLLNGTTPRVQVSRLLPFGANDPFLILLAEWETPLKRTELREILRAVRTRIRKQGAYGNRKLDEIVFVCPAQDYHSVSFAHVEEREGRQPRLEAFGWEADRIVATRTLREVNLPALVMPALNLLDEPEWRAGYKQWLSAWDVEAVTQRFYKQYEETFIQVERLIKGVKGDKRLFTQRLFNRLMFLQFLSKKGWLRFPSSSGKDYLTALWDGRDQSVNFYSAHLRPLFFTALNNPHVRSLKNSDSGLYSRIGDVPYLNGGLFREAEDEGKGERIEDAAFDLIINTLFARFNFTVHESTPLDVEVAVDPEMLGKVFEELVTARHESGSYYTTRPVVSFMCRQALKGYLAGGHAKVPAAITAFVDTGDASGLSDPEAILEALKSVTVCDLACGSGAYLLGMMQELLRLRECLFTAKVKDYKKIYDRKLEIIERNLYGADKDPFAVNVAMLRLWLSLVVDDERHPLDDPTVDVALPNLRYKIQVGDSLTAPAPDMSSLTLEQQEYMEDAEKLRQLHHRYFSLTRHGQDAHNKVLLEAEIAKAQAQIQALLGSDVTEGATDWRSAFAEVFAPRLPAVTLDGSQMALVNDVQAQQTFVEPAEAGGGFHIILANPPYVRADPQFKHLKDDEAARQKAIAEYKAYRSELMKSKIYTTLYEKWDLYVPFLERAYQLLQPGGGMVFIIPDAYNAAKYVSKSHEFFLQHTRVERIDFCSEIDLFDAGVNNTILYFVKTPPDGQHVPVRVRRWGDDRERFDDNAEVLPTFPQVEFGATLFKPSGQRNERTDTTTLGQLCYISYGLRANSDERLYRGEFVTNDLVSDVQDAVHPKLFVEGKNLMRWAIKHNYYLEWGTERAPGKFARPTFLQLHEAKEKLIALVVSSANPPVVYDDKQHFSTHTSCLFVPWHYLKNVKNNSIKKTAKYRSEVKPSDVPPALYREQLEAASKKFDLKYLLGVMNSEYAKGWLANERRSKLHIYPDDWKGLPIAPATPKQQAEIVALVQKCLDAKGVNCGGWEAEIDERVVALYGLLGA